MEQFMDQQRESIVVVQQLNKIFFLASVPEDGREEASLLWGKAVPIGCSVHLCGSFPYDTLYILRFEDVRHDLSVVGSEQP